MVEIFTTGYSTYTIDRWVSMVKKHGVEMLVDIRTMGKQASTARRPDVAKDALEIALPERGMKYVTIPELGGYRHKKDTGLDENDSPNRALNKENGFTSSAFRRYADYMYTNSAFEAGVEELLALASQYTLAVFCCEGWHRKCHRNILADYLTAFNLATVRHISSGVRAEVHIPLEFGEVRGNKLIYPERKVLTVL